MTDIDLTLPDFLDRTKPHAQRKHARLAPSASHRWINCPGSVRASEGIAGKQSVYANEGTAAHELASHCLKTGFDAERFADHVIDIEGKDIPIMFLMPGAPLGDGITRFVVDEEMVDGVQTYLDYVRGFFVGLADDQFEIDVEQRLDMTHIHPECFGTGDTVLYDVAKEWLHVFDLKYGKGVAVEVEDNPQLLTYGSGSVRRYHNRPLKGVTLHVVQPRASHADGPVRSKDYDILELLEFESDLAAAAKATEAVGAPLAAGEWCRFCPALPVCPTARREATDMALREFADEEGEPMAPEAMNGGQLAAILQEAEFIGNWVKAVQEHAHAEAVAGRCPPGFKLVAKRATRKWKGEAEEIKSALEIDYELDPEDYLTEPELKSPAQIEKTIGKKGFAVIEAKLVEKISSGTNLVPVGDKRPAVKMDGLEEFA